MPKKILFPALGFFFIFIGLFVSIDPKDTDAASTVGEKTLVLYDAASGTIPSPPLMGFTDFPPGVALPTYSDGMTVVDTTTAGTDTYAGWVSNGATTPEFPSLDRMVGFQVNITLQVENESHLNNHRAGFSLIILGSDARGVELAFWQNEIWAQSGDNTGGLFNHGEGVAFATTNLINYQVTIIGDIYTLTANGQPLFTGPVRDYSAFDGFPDPYHTPNFIFLGDDTTSAQARVRLSYVSVTGTAPTMPAGTTTSSPSASSSPATPVIVTPIPSPTPAQRGFPFCTSGWLSVVMITPIIIKKIGRVL